MPSITISELKRIIRIFMIFVALYAVAPRATAISFALDSIAEWGKFPRFCIGVYRWGDKFFNGYDSTYVKGTGYKFNVKIRTESWTDFYNFTLPNNMAMTMTSDPSTSAGLYLTYLALSGGYDVNISKLFTGESRRRSRLNFGFNCSLFAAEWNYVSNDVGTTIKRFGPKGNRYNTDVPFDGINTSEWALQTYYFFNHKRYSQAAAFNFSRVQERSQGSMYAGLYISNQRYSFDFKYLPASWLEQLPADWPDHKYQVDTYNYAFRLGYGYNWVFSKHWLLGVSESPIVGLRRGRVNSGEIKDSFAMSNRLSLAVSWNNRRWFAGIIGRFDANIFYDRSHTFIASILSVEASLGYRFNIW